MRNLGDPEKMSDLHEAGWVLGSVPLLNHYATSLHNNNKTVVIVEVEVVLVVVMYLPCYLFYYNFVYYLYLP